MYLKVNSAEIYCYTGGKALDHDKPTAIFIHGVLGDHSVWGLQSRYLAHHGWNVLAIDLPGHCRSAGDPLKTVEAGAEWIAALLDAAGVEKSALIGHSLGSLIALETAAQLKERISHLVLIGTAAPMKVSPALLDASLNEPEKALRLINVYSRSTLAAPPSSLGPGTWVYGASLALGRRVLASNTKANLFHLGFSACDQYVNAENAIAQITCPVLFVLGALDQMNQPRAAQGLIDRSRAAGKSVQVEMLPVGHHQMSETPDATLAAIRGFLANGR